MKDNQRYFNFPIQLLSGFMIDSDTCLSNNIAYACYTHAINLDHGTPAVRMKSTHNYFGISGGEKKHLITGKKLYEEHCNSKPPMTGVSKDVFFDFYTSSKSDFEKVCFLAFLALKSIIGTKAYCKIDNRYLLARMDGKTGSCDISELSAEIRKYANEYQTKKIKSELVDSWFLVTYSYHTRGFYVSFTLDLDQLVLEAEKRRQKAKVAVRKMEVKAAREKALFQLMSKPP